VGLNYYRAFVSDRYAGNGWQVLPDGEVTFDELSAHLEHFLELGGEDGITLGSDFDGSETPEWLSSCEHVSDLYALIEARFGETLAQKLFFENARAFFIRNETA